MKSPLQKLQCLLRAIKEWSELLTSLAVLVGIPAGSLALYWKATDISMSVSIRLLALAILGVLSCLLVLISISRKKDRDIKLLIGLIPKEPERRPDIEDRILAVLWHHSGCGAQYFTSRHPSLFKEDYKLIDHHLRELWEIDFVSRVSDAYSLDKAGRKYVVKYGLQTKAA